MTFEDPISWNVTESLLAASLVLIVGVALTKSIGFLNKFNIPSPIVGGLFFAIGAVALSQTLGVHISLNVTAKPTLLLLFFACVGLTADLHLLAKGGTRLARFLLILVPFVFLQDILGIALAGVLDMHPLMGLVAGSITLVGGHGTGAAYAQRFAEVNNLQGIMELTMTSATLGLVLGGVVGGPTAQRIIRKYALSSDSRKAVDGGVVGGPAVTPVTVPALVGSLAAALVALMIGQALAAAFEGGVVTVPSFLWCLVLGLAIRNGAPLIGIRMPDQASDLLGSFCLSLYLAWTMMALDLVNVVLLSGPILIVLALQTVAVILWARFVSFRTVGSDYESAIVSAAFCGFAMGATATAIANMQAVAKRYGPAPEAFIVVPIVGAFFVDIINALALTIFLSLKFVGG